jgi:hypothetical protein
MRRFLSIAALATFTTCAAQADTPMELTDAQLDRVSAGGGTRVDLPKSFQVKDKNGKWRKVNRRDVKVKK